MWQRSPFHCLVLSRHSPPRGAPQGTSERRCLRPHHVTSADKENLGDAAGSERLIDANAEVAGRSVLAWRSEWRNQELLQQILPLKDTRIATSPIPAGSANCQGRRPCPKYEEDAAPDTIDLSRNEAPGVETDGDPAAFFAYEQRFY